MNEKFSPSKRVPLKSYAHYENAPHGEWFLISNAKGGLYGYRRSDADDTYVTREVFEDREEAFDGKICYEDWQMPVMAQFLSGKYGYDTPDKTLDLMDPGYGSHEDVPLGSWYSIGDAGCLTCYRFSHGITIWDAAFFPAGEDYGPPPEPTYYLEEYEDVIRFFAGKAGLEALEEGGLAR